jgi:hypothetical protein
MAKSISDLQRLLPPPARPVAASGDWPAAEKKIGTPLPPDYKEFISLYGAGKICNFVWITSPFAANPEMELQQFSALALRNIASYESDGLVENPYPHFPKPGGILPFGNTENSNYLGWVTRGKADAWPVTVWDLDYSRFRELSNSNLLTFLIDLLNETSELLSSNVFPRDYFADRRFTPIDLDDTA